MRNELLRKYDWKDIPYLTGNSKLEVNLFPDIPKLLAKMMPDYDFGIFTYDDAWIIGAHSDGNPCRLKSSGQTGRLKRR